MYQTSNDVVRVFSTACIISDECIGAALLGSVAHCSFHINQGYIRSNAIRAVRLNDVSSPYLAIFESSVVVS